MGTTSMVTGWSDRRRLNWQVIRRLLAVVSRMTWSGSSQRHVGGAQVAVRPPAWPGFGLVGRLDRGPNRVSGDGGIRHLPWQGAHGPLRRVAGPVPSRLNDTYTIHIPSVNHHNVLPL